MGEVAAEQALTLGEVTANVNETKYLRYQAAVSLTKIGKAAAPLIQKFDQVLAVNHVKNVD